MLKKLKANLLITFIIFFIIHGVIWTIEGFTKSRGLLKEYWPFWIVLPIVLTILGLLQRD